MNKVTLKGTLRQVKQSHKIGDIQFYKAFLIVPRDDGNENMLTIKFKNNQVKDGDKVYIVGNLRSYNSFNKGKNKVDLYTYAMFEPYVEAHNEVLIDGYICKKNDIRITKSGKDVLDIILANVNEIGNDKINSFIPTVAWGKVAKQLKDSKVGDYIKIKGRLQSREYTKTLDTGEVELRLAQELSISEIL